MKDNSDPVKHSQTKIAPPTRTQLTVRLLGGLVVLAFLGGFLFLGHGSGDSRDLTQHGVSTQDASGSPRTASIANEPANDDLAAAGGVDGTAAENDVKLERLKEFARQKVKRLGGRLPNTPSGTVPQRNASMVVAPPTEPFEIVPGDLSIHPEVGVDGRPQFRASNPTHSMSMVFSPDGVEVRGDSNASPSADWNLSMGLVSYGYHAGQMMEVAKTDPMPEEQSVRYRHDQLTEWFDNDHKGLEHGFTLKQPPALDGVTPDGRGHGVVRAEVRFDTGLTPEWDASLQGYELKDTDGETVMEYGNLVVFDLLGRELPSWFESEGNDEGTILLAFDDTRAAYSVTVDPTLAVQLVKDINNDSSEYEGQPQEFISVGSTLYFRAWTLEHGWELWKSDGTETGTVMVKDIYPGPNNGYPSYMTAYNRELYFNADDGVHGAELWKTDGTDVGTLLVKDIWTGGNWGNPQDLTVLNGLLYFAANDGVHGWEFWKSDGSEDGTVMVQDIWVGSESSSPSQFTLLKNELLFAATDGNVGRELFALELQSAPVPSSDSYQTSEDTQFATTTIDGVLSNDSDPNGDPLTAQLVQTTANGVLTLQSDGSFTYEPALNFFGTDSFTYVASDGVETSGTVTVSIEVAGVNDAPTGAVDGYAVDEGRPHLVTPFRGSGWNQRNGARIRSEKLQRRHLCRREPGLGDRNITLPVRRRRREHSC